MNKREITNFLEAFPDDVEIYIGGTKLMAPHKYTLEYKPANLAAKGRVLINVKAAAVVSTGQRG